MITKELKVYEKYGGDFVCGKTQIREYALRSRMAIDKYTTNNGGPPNLEDANELKSMVTKALKEEILAMAMLKRADKKRFGNLQISLKHSYLLGTNHYPKTVAGVLKILNNYKSEYTPPSATPTTTGSGNAGNNETGSNRQSISFLQANGSQQVNYLKGTNDSFFRQITCRVCSLKGHYQSHCPVVNSSGNPFGSGSSGSATSETPRSGSRTETAGTDTAATPPASTQEVSTIRSGILLNQNSETYINPQWVLLDSESTDHIFCNKDLLTDIYPTSNGESLRLHTSAGSIDTQSKGKFGGFDVWYNPTCLAKMQM